MHHYGRKLAVICVMLLVSIYFVRPAYVYFTASPIPDPSKCHLAGTPEDPRLTARPSASGTVKVIQLSDLGEFIDRCQPTDAYYELNWDRPLQGPGDFNVRRKPEAVSKPKLVVLYVHGWHNNARPDKGDLVLFRQLMTELAEANRDKQVMTCPLKSVPPLM